MIVSVATFTRAILHSHGCPCAAVDWRESGESFCSFGFTKSLAYLPDVLDSFDKKLPQPSHPPNA